MEISFERNIDSSGRHIYEKTVCQNTRRGKKLGAEKTDNEEATKIDPYAITWTVKK